MSLNEKPSWIINLEGKLELNAALKQVYQQAEEVEQELKQAQLSKAGAILAYQFVANPNLHAFKITVEHVARSYFEVNLLKATNEHGRTVLFPTIDQLESDEIKSLFDTFKPDAMGMVEIHCKRDAIACLLTSTSEVNGAEAFHKLYPVDDQNAYA